MNMRMSGHMTLKSFLAAAKAALTVPSAERSKPLTFVVGNESADLDSLCSAVLYAYLRTNGSLKRLHIPLSNLPRADLALRTEMAAVLQNAGLQPSDLLTLTDLPDNLEPEDTRWILVDHNKLTGPLVKYKKQVVGCIDHHVDEGVVPKDANPRIIEPCGSCMSLIIEDSKKLWDELVGISGQSGSKTEEENKLAKLGLAPVLIDTINLTAKDKTKPKDEHGAKFLEKRIKFERFNPTAYYKHIEAVKEDISELSFRDIFRKDYKEWEEGPLKLGIACVVQDFDYLIDVKAGGSVETFLEKLGDWAREKELDLVGVMTTSHPGGEFQRHLLVWGNNQHAVKGIHHFEEIADSLELEQYGNGKLDKGDDRKAWRQKNLAASRKQVSPILRKALSEVSKN